MKYLEIEHAEKMFVILLKEAFGNERNIQFQEAKCNEQVNIGYRRFMIMTSISSLEKNIRYCDHWDNLRQLSDDAAIANCCDELFPVLRSTLEIVYEVCPEYHQVQAM